jgi:hypothetical protein
VVRERAVRWLGDIALAEGRGAEADKALKAMASDGNEVVALRERAIRSLGTSSANRAYLRSLYSRISEESLKERILRELGSGATAEDAAWVRDVALDAREATALRERAVRVLGEELGRSGDVRDLYPKLDQSDLKERALRVLAERDDAGAMEWLRHVAEDQSEVVSLRDRAIRLLAERDQLTYLRQIYPRLDRAELRERVLRSAAESGTPEAAAWLTTIVLDHTERSDLRERAVRELAEGHASSADLGDLYDGVDVSALKQRLVRLLAERGDDVAVKKLTAIAERDPDPSMRREASRRLGERTRNP